MITNEQKKSYEAFWNQQANERCCLYLYCPDKNYNGEILPDKTDATSYWEDIDYRTKKALQEIESTLHLADAFPTVFTNFGPGCLASCIGGTHKWALDTVWFENEPLITDWDNPPTIALNKLSDMYKLMDSYTNSLLTHGKGKFYTSIADLGGTYDIIAALRGTQDFLMDLYEYPDQIKAFAGKVQSIWKEVFNYYSNLLLKTQGAMTSWQPIYSEVSYYPLQCDFSAMISPDMFKEFILPDLEFKTSLMERSIYHWDGPGELPHLDHLLSLKRLSAIQWTPGTGSPDTTDEVWFDYYHRIQHAGKSLVLLSVDDPSTIENLLKNISTKGLFLCCNAQDEYQAKQILDVVNGYGVK